jgi:hypothetical protein
MEGRPPTRTKLHFGESLGFDSLTDGLPEGWAVKTAGMGSNPVRLASLLATTEGRVEEGSPGRVVA